MTEGLYRGSVPGSLDSSEMAEALLLMGPLPTPSGAAWRGSGEPMPVGDSSAGSSGLNPPAGPSDVAPGPSHGRPPRGHSSVSGRSVVASLDNLFLRRTRKARKAMPLPMRPATTRPMVIPTICRVEKPWLLASGPACGVDEADAGGSAMEERLEADTVVQELLNAELVIPVAEAEAACLDETNETEGVWPSLKRMVPRSAVGRVARPERVGL